MTIKSTFSSQSIPDRRQIGSSSSASSEASEPVVVKTEKSYRKAVVRELQDRSRKSKEELLENSILSKFTRPAGHLPPLLDHELSLMCLGSDSTHINASGITEKRAFELFIHAFTRMRGLDGFLIEGMAIPELMKAESQLSEFYQMEKSYAHLSKKDQVQQWGLQLARRVAHLAPGDSFIMPVGWLDRTVGHSMYLKLTKDQTTGNFEVRLYNASGNASGSIEKKHKLMVHPYLLFKDVTNKELFFTDNPAHDLDPAIFIQLLKLIKPSKGISYSLETVLTALLPFQGKLQPSDRLPSLFISMQRGPKCAIKSFNAMLLDLIADPALYRRHVIGVRFFTLMDHFKSYPLEEILKDPVKPFLLRQSAKSLLRMSDRAFIKKIIGHDEYLTLTATLIDLLDRIEPAKLPDISFEQKAQTVVLERAEHSYLESNHLRRISLEKSPSTKSPKNLIRQPNVVLNPDLGKNIGWNHLKALIEGLNEPKQLLPPHLLQIEFTVHHLRTLKNTPLEISIEEAKLLLNALLKFEEKWVKSVFAVGSSLSMSTQNAAMELLAIGYLLAVKCDVNNPQLEAFGVWHAHFEEESEAFLYTAHHPSMLEWRNELIHYFKEHFTDKPLLFNFVSEEFDENALFKGELTEADLYFRYDREISNEMLKRRYSDSYGHYFPENLKHVQALKSIAGIAAALVVSSSETSHIYGRIWRYSLNPETFVCGYGRQWTVKKQDHQKYTREYFSENTGVTASSSSSRSSTDPFARFRESLFWLHSPDALPSENQWMQERQNERKTYESWQKELFLRLSEPDVQFSSLLIELTNSLEHLKDGTIRSFAEAAIFKTIELERGTHSPLFWTIENDPSLLHRLDKWVVEAHRFSSLQKISEAHLNTHQAFVFTVILSSYIAAIRSRVNPDEQRPKKYDENKAKVLERLSEIKNSQLFIGSFRVELLIAECLMLMQNPLEKQSPTDQARLIFCMLELAPLLIESSEKQSQIISREIKCFWVRNVSEWARCFENEASLKDFCIEFLKRAGYESDDLVHMSCDRFGVVSFSSPRHNQSWQIFCTTGEVFLNGDLFGYSGADLPKTDSMVRLFQNRKQRLYANGHFITFRDKVWGDVRVDLATNKIERKILGSWYRYIPPSEKAMGRYSVNKALMFDHALWSSKDTDPKLIVTGLKTTDPLYQSNPHGELIQLNNRQNYFHKGIEHFPNASPLSCFESDAYICCYKTSSNRLILECPRYQTASKQTLAFIYDPTLDRWRWNENPEFFIAVENIQDIGVDRFLQLRNEDDSKRKILIPNHSFSAADPFSQKIQTNMPREDRDGQNGKMSFFEYDVSGTEMIAKSLNDKLFLTNLYLGTKNYKKAKELLESISRSDICDLSTSELFIRLTLSSQPLNDYSPNASAIRLLALSVFLPHFNWVLLKDSLKVDLTNIYDIYLRGIVSVDEPLLLSHSLEKTVIEALGSSQYESRLREINGRSFTKNSLSMSLDPQTEKWVFNRRHLPYISSAPNIDHLRENIRWLNQDPLAKYFLEHFWREGLNSIEVQKILYRINQKGPTADETWILFISALAAHNLEIPLIPSIDVSDEALLEWKKQVEALYDRLNHLSYDSLKPAILPPKRVYRKNTKTKPEIKITIAAVHSMPLPLKRDCESVFSELQNNYLEEAPLSVSMKKQISSENGPSKRHQYYLEERSMARALNEMEPKFKEGASFKRLRSDLEFEIRELKQKISLLENFILQKANQKPIDSLQYAVIQAKTYGHAREKISITSLCKICIQEGYQEKLRSLNPDLVEEDFEKIKEAVIEYMIEKTSLDQLNKILIPLKNALKHKTETSLSQALKELSFCRCYDEQAELFLLYFEYRSGMRLRLNQVRVVRGALEVILGKPNENGFVFHFKMGGGKTNVILSQLVEIASEAGKIPLVLTHYSQFTSVRNTLQKLQSSRFSKDLYTLECNLDQLSNPIKLDEILNALKGAKAQKQGIVMKSSFIQVVQLKFILECLRLKDSKSNQKSLDCLHKLAKILFIVENDSVCFFDELDLTSKIDTEVNVPFGEFKCVDEEIVNFAAEVYTHLLSAEIHRDLRLVENKQKDHDPIVLKDFIIPCVFRKLLDYDGLNLAGVPHLHEAFMRFTLGQISYADQEIADHESLNVDGLTQERRENIELLRLFNTWERSNDRYLIKSLELVGFMVLLRLALLETALSKTSNRNFGFDPQNLAGAIIPYLGPDSPNNTEFGFYYLALMLNLQEAINEKIKKEEVGFLAQKMHLAAQVFAAKERCQIEETLEAKQFFDLTGVPLLEIDQEGRLESALSYINDPQSPKRRLDFRKEIVAFHVKYYPEHLSSNPINLLEHSARPIGCSGSIWNLPSCHERLQNAMPDHGSEGAILNEIIARNALNIIEDDSLKSLLKRIENHPEKRLVRCIIDSGGFLTEGATQQGDEGVICNPIPKKILEFFNGLAGTDVQAIVYVQHQTPEKASGGLPEESFMILKKGAKQPIALDGLLAEDILKHGIALENIFFLIDEQRATGTNLPMPKDIICLQTVDPRMPTRTLLQGALRTRDYLTTSKVEQCLTVNGVNTILNTLKNNSVLSRNHLSSSSSIGVREIDLSILTMQDVTDALTFNEDVMITNQTLKSYPKKMHNAFRSTAIRHLMQYALHQNAGAIISSTENYRDFLVQKTEVGLWKNYGKIRPRVNLSHYLGNLQNTLSEALPKEGSFLKETESSTRGIIALANGNPDLSGSDAACSSNHFDSEVEFVQELAMELDFQRDLTLDLSIMEEYESYQNFGRGSIYVEKKWQLELIEGRLLLSSFISEIEPIRSSFERVYQKGEKIISHSQYGGFFSENLYQTNNLRSTYEAPTPIFDKAAKKADFVLILEEDQKCHVILLSKKDAKQFKSFIAEKKPHNAFLVDINGHAEVESYYPYQNRIKELGFENAVKEGLWMANLFNGNIFYLESNFEYSSEMIGPSQRRKLAGNFLVLRNVDNEKGLQRTLYSLLVDVHEIALRQNKGLMFSYRREKEKGRYNRYQRLPETEVVNLSPDKVQYLGPHQVRYLVTKEQVQQIPAEMLDMIHPSQVPLLKPSQVPLLKRKELIRELVEEQTRFTHRDQVKYLIHPQQIHGLVGRNVNEVKTADLQYVHDNELKHLHAKFTAFISPEKVSYLHESTVRHFNDLQIAGIFVESAAHIRAVPLAKLHLLRKEHAKHFSDLQIDSLSLDWQEKVQGVLPGKIHRLNPQFVKYFSDEQLREISIHREDFVREVPLDKLHLLNQGHVQHFTEDQIKAIPDSFKEMIKAVNPAKIGYLRSEHVEYFTPEQVSAIPIGRNDLIQAVPSGMIEHLKEGHVQHLIEGQIKAIPTQCRDLIRMVQLENVHLLSPSHVQHFTEDQIKAIPDSFKEMIQAVPPENVCLLSPSHALHFTKAQTRAIPDSFNALIQAVPLENTGWLHPNHVEYLTDEQIRRIPIEAQELIEQVAPAKLDLLSLGHVVHFTPNQIGEIPEAYRDMIQAVQPARVHYLKPMHVKHFTSEQILAIPESHDDLIQYILPEMAHVLDVRVVKFFTKEQIEAISKDQIDFIQAVNPAKIGYLRSEHVEHFTPEQIAAIPTDRNDLIQAVPSGLIEHVREGHVQHLIEDQIKAIPTQCRDLVRKVQLENVHLLSPSHVQHFTEEQIQAIPDDRIDLIRAVPAHQVNSLRKKHIGHFTDGQIEAISEENPELIQAVPRDRQGLLSSAHVKHFTEDQIGDLFPESSHLIQKVPNDKVHLLSSYHVKHMVDDQITSIPDDRQDLIQMVSKDQIQFLRPEHVPFLTDLQVQMIPCDRPDLIEKVSNSQLNFLDDQQFQQISDEQIYIIDNPALIPRIPLNKLDRLGREDVQYLTDAQISALPDYVPDEHHSDEEIKELRTYRENVIQAVPHDKMYLLNIKHAKHFSDEQMASIELERRDLIQGVLPGKVNHLDPVHVKHFSDQQIQWIGESNEAMVQAVPLDKLPLLRGSHVKHFTDEQISAIPENSGVLIRGVSPGKMHLLSKEAARHFSYHQIKSIPADAVDLIREIPCDKVGYVDPSQVKWLSDAQIQAIPGNHQEMIQAVPIEKLHLLNLSCFQQFSSAQVHAIAEAGASFSDELITAIQENAAVMIRAVPLDKLHLLRGPHVRHFTDEQISAIPENSGILIRSVPLEKMHLLKKEAARHFHYYQIKSIPTDAVDFIREVSCDKVRYLSPCQGQWLTDAQIQSIPNDKQGLIQSVPIEKINLLHPSCVEHFSNEQIAMIPRLYPRGVVLISETKRELLRPGICEYFSQWVNRRRVYDRMLQEGEHVNDRDYLFLMCSSEEWFLEAAGTRNFHLREIIQSVDLALTNHLMPWMAKYFSDEQIQWIDLANNDLRDAVLYEKIPLLKGGFVSALITRGRRFF